MTEPADRLTISDPHSVPVVFANYLSNSGVLNNVVNVTLATAQFTVRDDGTIDPDLIVCSRLRMDLVCARALYDALKQILEQSIQPKNGTTH